MAILARNSERVRGISPAQFYTKSQFSTRKIAMCEFRLRVCKIKDYTAISRTINIVNRETLPNFCRLYFKKD